MVRHGHAKDSPNLGFTSPAFRGYLCKRSGFPDRETEGEAKPIDCLQGWRPQFLRRSVNHKNPGDLKILKFFFTLSQLTVWIGPSMSEWSSSVASMIVDRHAAISIGRSNSNGVSISNDGVGMPWAEKCWSTFDVFTWIELANSSILLEDMVFDGRIGCYKILGFIREEKARTTTKWSYWMSWVRITGKCYQSRCHSACLTFQA